MENGIFKEKDCFKIITLMTINDECDLLKSLLSINWKASLGLSLSLLPYCALFCVEVSNRFKEIGIPFEQSYKHFDIEITRARLKLFNDKIGKAIKLVDKIYQDQDRTFREKLRFDWMRRLDLHCNLGITFYNKKVIANTYFLVSLLDKKDGHYVEPSGQEVYEFAEGIGQALKKVSDQFIHIQRNKTNTLKNTIKVLYKDVNVNRNKLFMIDGKESRELGILLLNVLGSICFTLYLIEDIVGDNTWKLRAQYLAMYYAREMLARVSERTEDSKVSSKIADCVANLHNIFIPCFRNCMMHYSFAGKGNILIKEEFFDIEKSLYGLVESCFDGKNYKELSNEVKDNLIMMEGLLDSMSLIKCSGVKNR